MHDDTIYSILKLDHFYFFCSVFSLQLKTIQPNALGVMFFLLSVKLVPECNRYTKKKKEIVNDEVVGRTTIETRIFQSSPPTYE